MQAKSLVEVEFFHQKRTSVLHKTALLRLLQLLSRDPSVDRMEETKKVSLPSLDSLYFFLLLSLQMARGERETAKVKLNVHTYTHFRFVSIVSICYRSKNWPKYSPRQKQQMAFFPAIKWMWKCKEAKENKRKEQKVFLVTRDSNKCTTDFRKDQPYTCVCQVNVQVTSKNFPPPFSMAHWRIGLPVEFIHGHCTHTYIDIYGDIRTPFSLWWKSKNGSTRRKGEMERARERARKKERERETACDLQHRINDWQWLLVWPITRVPP